MKKTKLLIGVLLSIVLFALPSAGAQDVVGRGSPPAATDESWVAAYRSLDARIAALEARIEKLAAILEAPTRPTAPPPEPPARTRPTRDRPQTPGDRPRDTEPARGPPVEVFWHPRNGSAKSITFPAVAVAQVIEDGVGFLCYTQTAPGLDARMVTVAAINGYAGRGWAYFEEFVVRSGGQELESIKGRHAIAPRGAIVRRFFLGVDAAKMATLEWMHDERPAPAWADEEAARELGNVAAEVGPYKFHWPFRSLSDSHGGWGVAPFHGGPDDWLTCPSGRQLRQQEMLLSYQRPIWLLGDLPEEPYWMGRTLPHRLSGYNADPDGWCEYAKKLAEFRPADHTHLTRQTGGPAALARWDLFARDCLLNSWRDFKVANSLTRKNTSSVWDKLLWPLRDKINETAGPVNSEGHRGLAHCLRLMRWMRPYVPPEELAPYEDAYREWIGKMASPMHGYTECTFPAPPELAPLQGAYIQAFHQQLNLFEFTLFGGLEEQVSKLSQYLTSSPPWYFEAKDIRESDTCLTYRSLRPGELRQYGAMTHGELLTHASASAFLADMKYRGCNGSSQEMDCTPRELWEPGL